MSLKKFKKKIYSFLYLSLDYPPNIGGISRLAGELTSQLHSKGLKVCVVTHSCKNKNTYIRPIADYYEVSKIKIIRYIQIILAVRYLGLKKPILTSLWNPEATLAMLAGAKRVSILVHGTELKIYKFKPFRTWLRRIVLERANNVICNSIYNEKIVNEIAPKAKTKVIYPAIDSQIFKKCYSKSKLRHLLELPLNKQIIITVSRLTESKGHETILKAISRLNSKYRENLLYVVVGKGRILDKLIKLTYELKINEQVRFVGHVDKNLPLWYGACDLSVLSSVGIEGFGIALIEAQASGIPVIGTRCGGIPEAIREGEGGWLIDQQDSIKLSELITKLFTDKKSVKNQGIIGRNRMKKEFNWNIYTKQLLKII